MIFKVTSSAPTNPEWWEWECTRSLIIRAVDSQQAINFAIAHIRTELYSICIEDDTSPYHWTEDNCEALLIQEDGASEIILADKVGA